MSCQRRLRAVLYLISVLSLFRYLICNVTKNHAKISIHNQSVPFKNHLYHTTSLLMKNMAAYHGHIQSLLYKKVCFLQVLSYIIYKKLMPPTTTVRVGVGGKIMAAVFYVL